MFEKKNNRNFLWLWIEVKSLRDFYSDLHFYFTSNFIVFDRFKKVKACANIIWHFKHTYQNKVTQIVSLDWENLLRNCERLFMGIVKQDKKNNTEPPTKSQKSELAPKWLNHVILAKTSLKHPFLLCTQNIYDWIINFSLVIFYVIWWYFYFHAL